MAEQRTTEIAELIPVAKGMIEVAAENARIFRQLGIMEVPFTGPGSTIDLLKVGSMTAASYTEGTARTFSTDTPTKVAVTPAEIDVAMSFTDKARKRSLAELVALYSPQIAKAVARKQDDDCAQEYSNFTGAATNEGDASASVAKLLATVADLRQSAKDQFDFARAALHTNHWDDLLLDSSGAILQAQIRGQGGPSAAVTGVIDLVAGVKIAFSTAIVLSTTYKNMIFSRRTIALVWKSLMEVDLWDDRNNKALRIAAGADYDVACYFPAEGHLYTVG